MHRRFAGNSRNMKFKGFKVSEWLKTVTCACLRRPLVLVLFMCVIGAYLGFYCGPRIWIMSAVSFGLLLFMYGSAETLKIPELLTIVFCCLGFGFFLIKISTYCDHLKTLDNSAFYSGEARIISVNSSDDGYKNIIVQLDDGEKVLLPTEDVYDYGDVLRIECRLSPIYTKGNPGDFDVRSYYIRKGIVRKIDKITVVSRKGGSSPIHLCYKFGSCIRKTFYSIWCSVTDDETAGLISAMIVGDDSHLAKDVKTSFKQSNLSHILVVSGAHVGYFTATVGILCAVFMKGRRSVVILTVCLILFGFVTGWGESAFRSILTFIVLGFLSLESRSIDHVSACALSGLILLCLDPFSAFSYGLLLSFGATFSIMLFCRNAGKLVRKWFPFLPDEVRTAISCMFCAYLGMLPVLLLMGSVISPLSVIVVVLAGFPAEVICSYGLVATLLSLVIPVTLVRRILFLPVKGLVVILRMLANVGSLEIPGRIRLDHVPLPLLVAVSCLLLYVLVRCGFKRRILAFAAVIALVGMIVRIFAFSVEKSRIYFLDVGQGDCALICHQGLNVLIDGGNKGNGETIRNVLEYLNIVRIDMAFISHLDTDHISGILELWDQGRIDRLYASFWGESMEMDQLRKAFPDLPSDVDILRKGDIFKVDESLSFELLWPNDPSDGGNDDSMVILCRMYDTRILFTGDISEEVEKVLPSDVLSDISVLKVSHHGSRFSTSDTFLKNKKVGAALISVGYNHYGHPSREVLKRLGSRSIPIYRTDERGCVLLSASGSEWQMDYYFG